MPKSRKIMVHKANDLPDSLRSELSLLEILIQRNPNRAKLIIDRLLEDGRKQKLQNLLPPVENFIDKNSGRV